MEATGDQGKSGFDGVAEGKGCQEVEKTRHNDSFKELVWKGREKTVYL